MAEKLLTDDQLAEALNVSRSTVWRYCRKLPDFPQPIKLTTGVTRWRASDLEAWIASKEAA